MKYSASNGGSNISETSGDSSHVYYVTTMAATGNEYELLMAYIRERVIQIIYFIVGTVGVIDNLLVIIVFVGFVGVNQRKTNIFMVNQSCIDLLASVWILLTGADKMTGTGMNPSSSLDEFLCRCWLTRMPIWATMIASTGNIMVLTLERYVAIVHPVFYKTKITNAVVYVGAAVAWLYGYGVSVPWTTGSSGISSEGTCLPYGVWPSIEVSRVVGIIGLGFMFYGPVTFMVFCYVRIIRRIRNKVDTTQSANDSFHHKASMNVLKTLITVCICFFACWTLNQVIWFGYQCGAVVDFTSWYYHLSVIMVLLSSIINPFVYASQYKQFQDGIRQLFRVIHKPAIITVTMKTNDTALPAVNAISHNVA